MKDEFSDRHQAIRLRLAGQPVEHLCQVLGRSRVWFHIWWRRYQALGVTGLFDLTRATHQPPRLAPQQFGWARDDALRDAPLEL